MAVLLTGFSMVNTLTLNCCGILKKGFISATLRSNKKLLRPLFYRTSNFLKILSQSKNFKLFTLSYFFLNCI